MTSRPAAVAGLFYPGDANELQQQILSLLNQAGTESVVDTPLNRQNLRALIVPHAGYIYSGLSAAFAYNTLVGQQSEQTSNFKNQRIKRVILLGPGHRVAVNGMAVPSVSSFTTPLGNVTLDQDEINELLKNKLVVSSDLAHKDEHSLEVQLPFLQSTIQQFKLIPIVVGQCSIDLISELLLRYINNPHDLIIISTDLSHFLEYFEAQQHDQNTGDKIMSFKYDQFGANDACGRVPMAGMLKLAKQSGLLIKQLDMRNSGDTAGDKDRVVGYGAWGLYAK